MQPVFDFFVWLFNNISRVTGLSYEAANILVYCLLVPASWCTIVWLRTRKRLWLLIIHFFAAYWFFHRAAVNEGSSVRFYHANIKALEWLGQQSARGYVGVSVQAGVVVPLLMYALLLFAPKKWLFTLYALFMLFLLGYFAWALLQFS